MFFKSIHRNIRIVLLIVIVVLIVVLGKIFYIQVIDYKKLNSLANSLWSRNLPIAADRGKIYSSDGVVLADNITTVSLVLIPNQISNKGDVVRDIAAILGVPEEVIREHVYKKSSMERVHPEGRRLSYDIAEKINALNYDGVYLLKESKRYYPYDNLLSHSLGYVGIDNQGLSGLELLYDDVLKGEGGSIKYFSDAKGKRLKEASVYEEAANGLDVYLTINFELQSTLERELNNVMTKYNADGAWGIAMNPKSGEILAISSRPDFNPNNYSDYDINEINRNMAIWASYEPGSTFKILTLSASVEEGTVDLLNDRFYDGGSVNVDGARIKCWKAGGHGDESFLEVVQNSCNPGFVELGNRLGTERLFNYINKFGYGKKTGIDLNGEATGIIFPVNKVGPVELATTSFGQGVSVTAIQQITAVSAAINGGKLYTPYVVKRISSDTGDIIKENSSKFVRNVISDNTSKTVRMALESVVALGTGRNAYIDSYRVGGKTGTAQKVKDGRYMDGNYILSFIGFMPANDPEVVVYIAIDNAKGITQYGGTVAAPVAKNVLKDAALILGVEKREDGLQKVYQWYDKKYSSIADVVGMSREDATKVLKGFNIEYTGNGKVVRKMSPKGGSHIAIGESVRLFLSD